MATLAEHLKMRFDEFTRNRGYSPDYAVRQMKKISFVLGEHLGNDYEKLTSTFEFHDKSQLQIDEKNWIVQTFNPEALACHTDTAIISINRRTQ